MILSNKLLEIIVCPKCKSGLDYRQTENRLVCNNCRLIYRIEEDIPILLIDEAESF